MVKFLSAVVERDSEPDSSPLNASAPLPLPLTVLVMPGSATPPAGGRIEPARDGADEMGGDAPMLPPAARAANTSCVGRRWGCCAPDGEALPSVVGLLAGVDDDQRSANESAMVQERGDGRKWLTKDRIVTRCGIKAPVTFDPTFITIFSSAGCCRPTRTQRSQKEAGYQYTTLVHMIAVMVIITLIRTSRLAERRANRILECVPIVLPRHERLYRKTYGVRLTWSSDHVKHPAMPLLFANAALSPSEYVSSYVTTVLRDVLNRNY
jgi:hypothetical protein